MARRSKRKPAEKSDAPADAGSGGGSAQTNESTRNLAAGAGGEPAPRLSFPALPSLSRIMSVVMLIFGILAVGALFYRVMAGFFVPLFLAALLVVLFRPVHEWIFVRTGHRRRLSAAATTGLILSSVLLPILLTISIAAGQFTAMISQVNFNDLTEALDRARAQLGISLEHADRFQRLDELADSLDKPDDARVLLGSINEAKSLVMFLQSNVGGPATAEAAADIAIEKLESFSDAVRQQNEQSGTASPLPATLDTDADIDDSDVQGLAATGVEENASIEQEELETREPFHRQSLSAAASIRTWMHAKLGGSLRSQVRLLANPSEQDFAELLGRARESLQPRFVRLTSATGGFLVQLTIGLIILVIAVYFFLIDGPAMVRTLMRLSPLDDNYERRLLIEFDRTSRAVVLASVLSALVQGILAAIAFYFLGFHSVILLFLITSLMALVPFLGAASVWIPCAIWLAAVDQRWTAAIFLAIYGATVVSSIDNVIKMFVLHGRSTLHPLFALLSVLGGVQVFGPIGILVGPMVVVFLQTLLEILNHELGAKEPATLDT